MNLDTAVGILSAWRKRAPDKRMWSLCLGSVCDLTDGNDRLPRFPAESDEAAIIAAATWLTAQDPSLGKTPGCPSQLHASAKLLVNAWEASAKQCRDWAHSPSSGLREQSRVIFAGRSDGYQNCADTLGCVLKLFELGMDISEIHIGQEEPG